ncbi:MAG: GAF domain-containing protein [Candidatus Eremiobacteraeota bacterium]|nr:GAF domain-containing protein [Candidatus Eremiobacteraeota bacterium]
MIEVVDYELLATQATGLLEGERDLIANAANLAAFLYQELPDVNWVGFYFVQGSDLVLGPFNGKPASSRLAHGRGVCGAAVRDRTTVIVDDVHAFSDHIVCDSASQSEIVVPLFHNDEIFGVLDIDSPVKARFTQADRDGLEQIVQCFVKATTIPGDIK